MTVINIKTHINPTEDINKVTKAIKNLFGNILLIYDESQNVITGKIHEIAGLKDFRSRIAQ